MSGMIFMRKELKYMLSVDKYAELKSVLYPYLQADKFVLYGVNNIYFDNLHNESIRTSLEKPIYKQKLRLRTYAESSDIAFLELKKKFKGKVYKRRIKIDRNIQDIVNIKGDNKHLAVSSFLEQYAKGLDKNSKALQILNEIIYVVKSQKLFAKLFLSYQREAFFVKDNPHIRITFDTDIAYRYDDLSFNNSASDNKLFPISHYLMEIKADCPLPLYLVNILSDLKIYPTSFSKYGSIYKKELQSVVF